MKKISKMALICLTVLSLCMTLCIPSFSYAQEADVLNTSNLESENIRISCEKNALVFSDFPDRDNFNFVMISLCNKNGGTFRERYYQTDEMIRYPINNILDGSYYIGIYSSNERYGTYWSYMYGTKGIKIKIQNGVVSFAESPVYQNNKAIYESNCSDKNALAYYLKPSWGVESDNKKIIKQAKSIVSNKDSDYEKVRKVHDWVCNNVWYNWDGYLTGEYGATSAVKVLANKRSVCQGYANLTAALLRALGIPTKVVSGYALGVSTNGWTNDIVNGSRSNHAWNEAYVDGRWIIIDTTWDSNNKYENGTFSKNTGLEDYRYFDPTIEYFSYDHKITESQEYEDYIKEVIQYNVSYSTNKLKLCKGGTKQKSGKLVAEILGDDKQSKQITISYYSKDPSVATVNANGVVTAKGVGTTYVVIKASIGSITNEYKVKVTVEEPSITMVSKIEKLKVGKTATLKVQTFGIKSLKWTSSNPAVATVSSTGKVTAKKAGTVNITVTGCGQTVTFKLKIQ